MAIFCIYVRFQGVTFGIITFFSKMKNWQSIFFLQTATLPKKNIGVPPPLATKTNASTTVSTKPRGAPHFFGPHRWGRTSNQRLNMPSFITDFPWDFHGISPKGSHYYGAGKKTHGILERLEIRRWRYGKWIFFFDSIGWFLGSMLIFAGVLLMEARDGQALDFGKMYTMDLQGFQHVSIGPGFLPSTASNVT